MTYSSCRFNSLECAAVCSCTLSDKIMQLSVHQYVSDDLLRSNLVLVTEKIETQKSEGILINLVGMPHISPSMERWLVLRWQQLALKTNLVYCAIVISDQLLSVPLKRCVMSMSYHFDITLHSDFQKAYSWLQFKTKHQQHHYAKSYFTEQFTGIS